MHTGTRWKFFPSAVGSVLAGEEGGLSLPSTPIESLHPSRHEQTCHFVHGAGLKDPMVSLKLVVP